MGRPEVVQLASSDVAPEDFWRRVVVKRQPGHCQLQIECRPNAQQAFGKGNKIAMTFGEFIRRMSQGDDSVYLTTQQVGIAVDGHPELLAPPLTALRHDFPLQPSLTGNLVPQQMNLWMGAATEGASSGLHHDYHDNLYVLLRGRKRFRLYPPSAAPQMYTRGKLIKIHSNGRIVYQGQGDVRADGADAKEAARWEAQAAAEKAVAEAEAAVARGEPAGRKLLARAERQLEAVLDQALDAEGLGADWDDLVDDFDEEVDDDSEDERTAPRAGHAAHARSPSSATGGAAAAAAEEDPDSFSGVDLSLPEAELRRQFPRFPGKRAALEVVVEAGCMLYLPAGWFHEVTSFGQSVEGGHMALNYWFHPPDNLDPGAFDTPYKSDYYPALWRSRLATLQLPQRSPRQQQSRLDDSCPQLPPPQPERDGGSSNSNSRKRARVDVVRDSSENTKQAAAVADDGHDRAAGALSHNDVRPSKSASRKRRKLGVSGGDRGGHTGHVVHQDAEDCDAQVAATDASVPVQLQQLIRASLANALLGWAPTRRVCRSRPGRRHHMNVVVWRKVPASEDV